MAQELNTEVLTQFPPPASPRHLSYEEFLREYDGQHAEWVNFEVIKPMSVSDKHDDLVGLLKAALRFYVENKELGKIRGEPYQMKMTLPDGVHGREPDIFFVKNENFNRIGKKFFEGAADLTIEVVSPESYYRDTQDKFNEYEQAGVKEYWIIDIERQTSQFYVLDETGKYRLRQLDAGGIFQSTVIDGLWLRVEWFWREPLPQMAAIFKEWKLI